MENPLLEKRWKRTYKEKLKSIPFMSISVVVLSIIAVLFGFKYIFIDDIRTKSSFGLFPVNKDYGDYLIGDVVSMGVDGKIVRKSGTTIYKNHYLFKNKVMLNLQTLLLDDNISICVYHGKITATKYTDKDVIIAEFDKALPSLQIGKTRQIDRIVGKKHSNVFFVIGSSQILPVSVDYTDQQFHIIFGEEVVYYESVLDLNPAVASQEDGHLCLVFNDNDYFFRIMMVTLDFVTKSVIIESSIQVASLTEFYSVTYIKHDVLAIAYTVHDDANITNSIHMMLGYEDRSTNNLTLSLVSSVNITNINRVMFLDTASWYHLDSLNSHMIIAYTTNMPQDGLIIRLLSYNQKTRRLTVGPRMSNMNSGEIDGDSHCIHYLSILPLENHRFIVISYISYNQQIYYSSIINNGYTALLIGRCSPAVELVVEGPQFIISRAISDITKEYYFVSAAEYGNRVFLFECLHKYSSVDTSLSILDIYNRPIGIITNIKNGMATVLFQGKFPIPPSCSAVKKGKLYYSNSRAEYIEGEWIGQRGIDSYYIYIENDERMILTDIRNRIGYGIENNVLMIQPEFGYR